MAATAESIVKRFLLANPSITEEELQWRVDGRLEWVCEDGIGHTVYAPDWSDYVHGCSGNCRDIHIPKWTAEERRGDFV